MTKMEKGRGALGNPVGRFERTGREAFDDGWEPDEEGAALKTSVAEEEARTIISRNDSPDVPFEQSINPYRGCEHGCIYCYARPSHAYLGLSPGLDFETRLYAKTNAAALLRRELAKPGYLCRPIALGANTDPYQPVERQWRITRQIIEILAECKHPLTIVTKSALIERDLDLLAPMAEKGLVQVYISLPTLDRGVSRRLEPRAPSPQRRLQTLGALAQAGVPCGVLVAPVIPALTDARLEAVLAKPGRPGPLLPPMCCCACPTRWRSCSGPGWRATTR
jgi:DNA repair photolyase